MEIFEEDGDGEQSLSEGGSGSQLVRTSNEHLLRGFAWIFRGSLNNFLALLLAAPFRFFGASFRPPSCTSDTAPSRVYALSEICHTDIRR